jgi:hypothetical protein
VNRTADKLLVMIIWRGAKLYCRRRYRRRGRGGRRAALGGLLGVVGLGAAIAVLRSRGSRRPAGHGSGRAA